MRWPWLLAGILFIFALPVALLTTNVRLVANSLGFYQGGYQKYQSYERTGLDKGELDRATQAMIDYLNSGKGLIDVQVRRGGETFPLFNQRDSLHLKDVKDLIQLVYRLQEISLVYLAFFTVMALLGRGGKPLLRLARAWLLGGIFTVGLLLAVGLALFLDFDRLFLQFHLVSFSNELWMLDPATSYLIRMVPQGFFFDLALTVAGWSLAQGAVLAMLAGGTLAWQRRHS